MPIQGFKQPVESERPAEVDSPSSASAGSGRSGSAESGRRGGGGQAMCHHYLRGHCSRGNTCSFSHGPGSAAPAPPAAARVPPGYCYKFQQGLCQRGDACSFLHETPGRKAPAATPAPAPVRRDASELRAELAEAEVAHLRAQMAEAQARQLTEGAEAHVRRLQGQVNRAKSGISSELRAQVAEAEVRHLRAQVAQAEARQVMEKAAAVEQRLRALVGVDPVRPPPAPAPAPAPQPAPPTPAATPKTENCPYFMNGNCVNGSACRFVHSEEARMAKQLEDTRRKKDARRRELEGAKQFGAVRDSMMEQVAGVRAQIAQRMRQANSIDLVIAMDCTGSMSSYIAMAKDSVLKMIDDIRRDNANVAVRLAFVGYRDHCDGDRRIALVPFTDQYETVRRFIAKQKADGGGDGPEDVAGSIQAALDLDWQSAAKVLVLVGDAPCHKAEFHTSSGQDSTRFAAVYARDPCIKQQMRTLASRGIDFTILEVQPSNTSKMVEILKREYAAAPLPEDGTARKFEAVKLSSPADVNRLLPTVVSAASSSISASKSRSSLRAVREAALKGKPSGWVRGAAAALGFIDEEGEEEEAEEPATRAAPKDVALSWAKVESLPAERARRYTYTLMPGDSVDWSNPKLRLVTQETTVKISPDSFAHGAMRTAHGMVDVNMGKRMVGKAYHKIRGSEAVVKRDVEMQAVARVLARDFSSHAEVPSQSAVDFLSTSHYELLDRPEGHWMKHFSAEPFITGSYRKYSNNDDWVSSVDSPFNTAAQAFSHYTWEHTYGNLMVVDLQGVNGVMTDPQIHSKDCCDSRFGEGNKGTGGMSTFFAQHKCNAVCRALKLSPMSAESSSGEDVAPTRPAASAAAAETDSMELSCSLCGDIFGTTHAAFVESRGKKREEYCGDCTAKVAQKEQVQCSGAGCATAIKYSPYWYRMFGMERPKKCEVCKGRNRAGAAAAAASAGR